MISAYGGQVLTSIVLVYYTRLSSCFKVYSVQYSAIVDYSVVARHSILKYSYKMNWVALYFTVQYCNYYNK